LNSTLAKKLKNIWTILLFLLPVVIIYNIREKGDESKRFYKAMEISGVIDSIYYGDKKEASVKINNKIYSLYYFGIRKGEDIKVGDSLYKAKKEKNLELHSKTKTGEYICTEIYKMK
tara:strand:+ start:154167 stop:154517 length:351 start_codon:yes stop_codon:yes gene_type:complete